LCDGTVHVNFDFICLEWRRDLHDRCELFNDCSVWVFDTKGTAKVLTKRAVVDEIVVLILLADILLAFEESAEPAQNDVGWLRFVVPFLLLAVRVRDTGGGEVVGERKAQGQCNE
jgi:hypothetical protein